MLVSRTRTERRPGAAFARTVGSYRVTLGGEALSGLEGATVETHGPGDNSLAGVTSHVRIEAGIYPLYTYGGEKYATLNYETDPGIGKRPWPAIGIGETGTRSGIIIHPAAGYLMSIGTINLSKPLAGPSDNLEFQDSSQRTIALIDAMKEKLSVNFPTTNNERIPNAWIVISGEPTDEAAGN